MRYTGPLGKSFEGDKQRAMDLQSRARVVVGRLLYALKRQGGLGQQYGTERQADGSVIHAYVLSNIAGQQPLIRTWIESPVGVGTNEEPKQLEYFDGLLVLAVPYKLYQETLQGKYGYVGDPQLTKIRYAEDYLRGRVAAPWYAVSDSEPTFGEDSRVLYTYQGEATKRHTVWEQREVAEDEELGFVDSAPANGEVPYTKVYVGPVYFDAYYIKLSNFLSRQMARVAITSTGIPECAARNDNDIFVLMHPKPNGIDYYLPTFRVAVFSADFSHRYTINIPTARGFDGFGYITLWGRQFVRAHDTGFFALLLFDDYAWRLFSIDTTETPVVSWYVDLDGYPNHIFDTSDTGYVGNLLDSNTKYWAVPRYDGYGNQVVTLGLVTDGSLVGNIVLGPSGSSTRENAVVAVAFYRSFLFVVMAGSNGNTEEQFAAGYSKAKVLVFDTSGYEENGISNDPVAAVPFSAIAQLLGYNEPCMIDFVPSYSFHRGARA